MKIIIKIGTSSLSREDGTINMDIIKNLSYTIGKLMINGHDIILVTSGAVGCGKSIMNQALNDQIYLRNKKLCSNSNYSTIDKTILSGMGQTTLLSYYAQEFRKLGFLIEQVLIAGKKDIDNIKDNLNKCFEIGIVPIINANDTVYDKELVEDSNKRFSDNDILAAELANSINADALILVTNVEGYLDHNNEVVSQIDYEKIDDFISNTNSSVSKGGTGGMSSKLSTCKISGCDTYIIHNLQICNIDLLLNGAKIGTKISVNKFRNIIDINYSEEVEDKENSGVQKVLKTFYKKCNN